MPCIVAYIKEGHVSTKKLLLLQDALAALKSGRLPTPSALPSFENIKEIVGFPQYYTEEERYTTTSSTSTSSSYNRSSGWSQISVD